MEIRFSIETGLTEEDVNESSRLAEEFFNMQEKPDEIPASEENKDFIFCYSRCTRDEN